MSKTWRQRCAPIIAKVIADNGTDDTKKLKAALFDAYPFGMRKYWPYKVWLDEIRCQLGTKKPKKVDVPKEQMRMFDDHD